MRHVPFTSRLFGWPMQSHGSAPTSAVDVIGVAVDSGNCVAPGARGGPESIRLASHAVVPPRVRGLDRGDILPSGGEDLGNTFKCVEFEVDATVTRGRLPLVLGGDHAISFAPVARLQRRQDICVVWFDAHTDFSPWDGRPGHNHKQVLRRIAGLPRVKRILQVGYRGYTLSDEHRLDKHVAVLSSAEARRGGAEALAACLPRGIACYISVDIDVLDPRWAPGTSTPVPGGLSPDMLADLLVTIFRECQVTGMDIMEVNPALDRSGTTSLIAAWLLRTVLDSWVYDKIQHDEQEGIR